jgi:hypothetical protein
MTTSQKTAIANRMIKHIQVCISHKMNFSDMWDYVDQDIDLTNPETSQLFTTVFFANFKFEQLCN